MLITSLIVIISVPSGCSSTQKIANSATQIRKEAKEISDSLDESSKQISKNTDELKSSKLQKQEQKLVDNIEDETKEVSKASKDIESIVNESENISQHVSNVEDKTPAWISAIIYSAIAASILGLIFLLWRLGILDIIGTVISYITPTPKKTKNEASILAKMKDDKNKRELVAERRAKDKKFDKEYKKALQEEKEQDD